MRNGLHQRLAGIEDDAGWDGVTREDENLSRSARKAVGMAGAIVAPRGSEQFLCVVMKEKLSISGNIGGPAPGSHMACADPGA